MNMVFANHSKEDVIHPLTVKEKELAQERDLVPKKANQDGQVFNSSCRGHTSPMQRWKNGHPKSSSV